MHRLLLFICLSGLAATVYAQPCNIGKVESVSGQAFVERHAQKFRLDTDILLCANDKFVTDESSVAKLRLRDGSLITVGKDSEFVIRDYHIYKNKPNNAQFELIKGAFRSVTGFITQRSHRYEVKTRMATIGIRGTDFWGGFGLTENGLDVVMLDGHGVYVTDNNGVTVELDKPGLGTTVTETTPPSAAKKWGDDKVAKAIATITP